MWLGLSSHLRRHLRKDATARQSNTRPSSNGKRVSLQEDAQQHRENLTCRRHRRQDERVEVGNGVEDEALPDGRADGELDDLCVNLWVGRVERQSGPDLAQSCRDDHGGDAHVEVRPELQKR